MEATQTLDYYEFLQISPNADSDTIHRVYRFLASRYHPDNPDSGDPEKFYLLKSAYDVLSDPAQRAQYDAECCANEPAEQPMSSSVDFMDSLQGELNRRLAVLAVLYYQRRTNPWRPEVSLADIEKRMGFPRDYLDFTTWYLTKKGYITKADNSDFSLTAEGVDFVETQRISIPVLNKLLTSGAEAAASAAAEASISALDTHSAAANETTTKGAGAAATEPPAATAGSTDAPTPQAAAEAAPRISEAETASVKEHARPTTPGRATASAHAIPGLEAITLSKIAPVTIPAPPPSTLEKLVMVGKSLVKDRRANAKERRTGSLDLRSSKVERRQSNRDRRANS